MGRRWLWRVLPLLAPAWASGKYQEPDLVVVVPQSIILDGDLGPSVAWLYKDPRCAQTKTSTCSREVWGALPLHRDARGHGSQFTRISQLLTLPKRFRIPDTLIEARLMKVFVIDVKSYGSHEIATCYARPTAPISGEPNKVYNEMGARFVSISFGDCFCEGTRDTC